MAIFGAKFRLGKPSVKAGVKISLQKPFCVFCFHLLEKSSIYCIL